MNARIITVAAAILALAACTESPTASGASESPIAVADAAVSIGSSVHWNRMAITLFRARGGTPGRVNAYLSLGQYLAVLEAERVTVTAEQSRNEGSALVPLPSAAGAAAGASAVVLKQFYPLDAALIDAELELQRASLERSGERPAELAAGMAIGSAIGLTILARVASDNFGLTSPGSPPVGPGFWIGNGGPITRGAFGARPFFLKFASELRAAPPPSYGSPTYLAALEEVRAMSRTRTPEQVAIVQKWVPSSGVRFNGIATDLIVKHRWTELAAARLLAYANTAAWDALIGCFDTKFAYWYARPTEADPLIPLAVTLPNHPSYPSAHSCETGAWHVMLTGAFPAERAMLDDVAQEASMSRVVGGLHYRFDGEAGLELGRAAARLANARRGLEPIQKGQH